MEGDDQPVPVVAFWDGRPEASLPSGKRVDAPTKETKSWR